MSVITLPVSEAKQRFTEIVKDAEKYFNRYLVTKNGKDAAVVMSAEEYESLLETLDILANKKEVFAIREASSQHRRGDTVLLERYLSQKQRSQRQTRRR